MLDDVKDLLKEYKKETSKYIRILDKMASLGFMSDDDSESYKEIKAASNKLLEVIDFYMEEKNG